ncbi:Gfo/Idh/MocA family protein [Microbacterium sp.]|uniref:Gfo/Idh/MocA family protein n=1 Tax=Microbacterium sp. TaxID=51671 RepID=UPI0039E5AAAC
MSGRLRVVIAGAGRFGTLHARVWTEAGAEVVGVNDADPVRAERLGLACSAEWDADLSALLSRVGAEVVVVSSEESSHASVALTALRAGAHAFVEKPFALRPADAELMIREAEQRGLTAYAGHISRFAQPYEYVRDALDTGRLGRLWALRLRRDFSRDWYSDFGSRIHPLWESGVHDIDLAIHFAQSEPVSVVAVQSGAAGSAAPSVFSMLVAFADGVTATIESAWAVPRGGPRSLTGVLELDGTIAAECEVIGSEGVIKQRLVGDSLVEWADAGVMTPDLSLWPERDGRVGGALRAEVDDAVRVFSGGKPNTRMPHAEALWSVRVASAAERSFEQGGARVEIPAD